MYFSHIFSSRKLVLKNWCNTVSGHPCGCTSTKVNPINWGQSAPCGCHESPFFWHYTYHSWHAAKPSSIISRWGAASTPTPEVSYPHLSPTDKLKKIIYATYLLFCINICLLNEYFHRRKKWFENWIRLSPVSEKWI